MTLICCFYDRAALALKEWISPLKEERVPVTSSSNDVMQMSTHIEYTHRVATDSPQNWLYWGNLLKKLLKEGHYRRWFSSPSSGRSLRCGPTWLWMTNPARTSTLFPNWKSHSHFCFYCICTFFFLPLMISSNHCVLSRSPSSLHHVVPAPSSSSMTPVTLWDKS